MKLSTDIRIFFPPNSTVRPTNAKVWRTVIWERARAVPSSKQSSRPRPPKKLLNCGYLFFLALLVTATAVAFTVFQVVRNSQKVEIVTRFHGVAGRIIDAFFSIPNKKVGPLGALRVAYTAQARDTNSTWPFVALTSFQQRAQVVRRVSESLHVIIMPVVYDSVRAQWEEYVPKAQAWMDESLQYESKVGMEMFSKNYTTLFEYSNNVTRFPIYTSIRKPTDIPEIAKGPGPYMPFWQSSPFLSGFLNMDYYNNTVYFKETPDVLRTGAVYFSDFLYLPQDEAKHDALYSNFLSNFAQRKVQYEGDALGHIFLPVFKSFNKTDNETVAILFSLFQWSSHFKNILSQEESGIMMVLDNGCSETFTYKIDGANVTFIGQGDLHNAKYDDMMEEGSYSSLRRLEDGTEYGLKFQHDYCPVRIRIFPSQEFVESITTNQPILMAITVLIVFAFTILMFITYDRLVERRQQLVLDRAMQSSAIVTSLFPKAYADRLLNKNIPTSDTSSNRYSSSNKRLKSFLIGDSDNPIAEQPIADLFPFTTVLFADIAGFTAWSSTREPVQVFILLQQLYQAFDVIAHKRKVFKVETIGDSYVAVTGVPTPQKMHAVIMTNFARECQLTVVKVTANLGVTLGPDTCDLRMRIGIHSGPVTAGVLRGERARFQLFGDTVNTASRMESTGIPTKIHVSSATAALLIQSDKAHWVEPRKDTVNIKGKGILDTFWVVTKKQSSPYSVHARDDGSVVGMEEVVHTSSDIERRHMLVSWICELLHVHMKHLVAKRETEPVKKKCIQHELFNTVTTTNPMDEVVEAIVLPEYSGLRDSYDNIDDIDIGTVIREQLYSFVYAIAASYRDNPFHNFEHACHVTMSVSKLLMRVVTPDVDMENIQGDFASHLHDYTHGINSDPITILAIIFSAVIHDLDHRGVSNVQLMKEEPEMGKLYNGKSVAEQNSLDIAWQIFLQVEYTNLREFLFHNEAEMNRFRQVLVNVVLATDIFDKELNDLRKQRWEKAFISQVESSACQRQHQNLRATIVIEHIIQASDVSHTMQHWHVYRKWNNMLFKEMYQAYQTGRMASNPAEFWYKGELSFFDNYIIPLAKKLKDCHVFGVSSDEYLIYAEQNRAEWETRGEEFVIQMVNDMTQADI